MGGKYKRFVLTEGIEAILPNYDNGPFDPPMVLRTLKDNFRNKSNTGVDVDLALKINYLLF